MTTQTSCLFNIIFYVETGVLATQYQKLLELLQKKFPCKAIFLIEDASIKDDTWTARDTVVQFGVQSRGKIPFLILSSLMPDLPIYVIWGQDPNIKNPILFDLKAIATKIVFDPSTALHLKEFSRQLLTQMESKKCGITDFSWFTISGWRDLLATVFYSEEKIDQLFKASMIRIKYNAPQGVSKERSDSAAIYLQAWLAAQLNWKIYDVEPIEGHIRICYKHFDHDTIVLLIPEITPNLAAGAISSIEIETNAHHHFLFQRNERNVKVFISSPDLCEIPFQTRLVEPPREQLVLNELFWRGTAPSYENMLRLLYQTNWND